MSNIKDDLIADLSAIDARREKLREALEKLKTEYQVFTSTRFRSRCRQKIFDNSFDELDYRTPRNTGDRLGHMRFPEPGYTLYKDKQTDGRDFPKEEDNKFWNIKTASIYRYIFDTNFFLKYSKHCNVNSYVHCYMVK